MLEDRFIEYISGIKSPFDEQELTQEDISYDGYMKYFRDCMLKSIGTDEAGVQFTSYWDEFSKSCDLQQRSHFILNCVNRIVRHYAMSYLSYMLTQNTYTQTELIALINFFVHKVWLKYFPKFVSFISEKIFKDKGALKIFVTSDYDSFLTKLDESKSCNPIIKEYFKFCPREEGIDTLINILSDDLTGNYIEQYKRYSKNLTEESL